MMRSTLARVREGARIVGFSAIFAVAALVTNLLVMAVFAMCFGYLDDGTSLLAPRGIDDVSEALVAEDGTYGLSEGVAEGLRASDRWALLIGDDGSLLWSEGLPDDIPDHYDMADVASFTRWYLNDYPVVTRVRDDGILVVGSPRGTVWKYVYNTDMNTVLLALGLILALLLSNMAVVIALARRYARKGWAERDHARREWIAAVSHDVRTPLAVALADADALVGDEELGLGQRLRAERIEAKVGEVASLVADLNVANRMSYAMEPLDATPVALAPIVRSVVAEALNDDVDGSHPIELELSDDAETIMVKGDAALLRRMLSNLVGNSVRHNPSGCTVRVSLARLPKRPFRRQRCVLVVEDDGRGLEAEMLRTLRQEPSDDLPEHGLGLVIVRRIAQACSSTVRFMASETGGARCEVTFLVR